MKEKGQDSRRKGIKKEDRARQGKDIEHIIYIYIKVYKGRKRGDKRGDRWESWDAWSH